MVARLTLRQAARRARPGTGRSPLPRLEGAVGRVDRLLGVGKAGIPPALDAGDRRFESDRPDSSPTSNVASRGRHGPPTLCRPLRPVSVSGNGQPLMFSCESVEPVSTHEGY